MSKYIYIFIACFYIIYIYIFIYKYIHIYFEKLHGLREVYIYSYIYESKYNAFISLDFSTLVDFRVYLYLN